VVPHQVGRGVIVVDLVDPAVLWVVAQLHPLLVILAAQ